jgi:hypothetical protein
MKDLKGLEHRLNNPAGIRTQDGSDFEQLNNVDASLATFVFRDEGLRPS